MKALRILLSIIVILLALFFIGGMLLPKTYKISRTVIINATDSLVYMNVADMNNFLRWNPWTKIEPEAKVTISGVPAQTGHLWEWKGKKTGSGTMELIQAQPYSLAEFQLHFLEPFESQAISGFTFKKTAEGTEVEWYMSGKANSIPDRWMGLSMDMMMDKDFTSGLQALKELSEK
ncbi:SRPBCC family protein [Daejeonella sp. H1SJ63]|uniref:SRPBCC family protein n=1 Tax=Daejeonella sp. H1SJ63 TaxID=3034145 RepID=UPI0023EB033F|nr:SRPBCC family protein [Daejeonella sp. H1SJ63]